jgi:hypothetical protein
MKIIPDPDNKYDVVRVPRSGPRGRPSLNAEQIKQLRQAIAHDGVEFFIVATPKLRAMLLKGTDLLANQIDSWIQTVFIEGNGIRIDSSIVIEWISGKLDARNAFVLNHCDVMIEGVGQDQFRLTPDQTQGDRDARPISGKDASNSSKEEDNKEVS